MKGLCKRKDKKKGSNIFEGGGGGGGGGGGEEWAGPVFPHFLFRRTS